MRSYQQYLEELAKFKGNPLRKELTLGSGSSSDMADSLKRHLGAETLGLGSFAATIQHPTKPDQVLKFYHNDSAYHRFAKYAHENHKNDPHLPKVYGVHPIDDHIGVVRMEKLHPLDMEKPHNQKLIGQTSNLWGAHQADEHLNDSPEHPLTGQGIKNIHPGLHKTIKGIHSQFRHKNYTFDLHGANIMQRVDGTHVVTDPYATFANHSDLKTIKEHMISELAKLHGNPIVQAAKETLAHDPKLVHGQPHPSEFTRKLVSMGHTPKELSSGLFGAVYQHPTKPDQVIKIFRRDTAYENFAKHAKANHHKDPHLPVIHSIHHIGPDIGMVRMEKLEPYKHIRNLGNDEVDTHPLPHRINGDVGAYDTSYEARDTKAYHPSVHQTLSDISNKFGHKRYKFDLHRDNMMHRADGTPVVTDPIISKGGNTSDRTSDSNKESPSTHGITSLVNLMKRKSHPMHSPSEPGDLHEDAMVGGTPPTNNVGTGNIAGYSPVMTPILRRKKFAGMDVFEVSQDTFHKSRFSKKHYQHWKAYLGEDDTGRAIREWATKNPKKPIILQDERSGVMSFARYGGRQR